MSEERRIAALEEPQAGHRQHNPLLNPRFLLATTSVLLLALVSFQLPEEFWHQLLAHRYIRADLIGFFTLSGIYMLAVLLLAPLSPFALAAGLLFGFWWGALLAILAVNLGAVLAYCLARFLLREQLEAQLLADGALRGKKLALMAQTLRGNTVKTIAILRLNPVVPFSLHNYLCGATGVRFGPYLLGTLLGASPFTVALVYLGYAGRRLMQATGIEVEEWTLIIFAAGLLLTLPMTWALFRKALKAQNNKVQKGEPGQ